MADNVARCGLKTNPNWVTSTAIFPEKYGWVGIPYMIKAIKGQSVPKNLYVPLIAVTGQDDRQLLQAELLRDSEHDQSTAGRPLQAIRV